MSTRAENSQCYMKGPYAAVDDMEAQDHQVSQSSVLYLLQEASKLEVPAKALEYAESDAAKATEVNLEQRQSTADCHWPCQFPGGRSGQDISQPCFSGSFSLLHTYEDSSPWEVMSLINQQCEKLLHSGQADGEEEDFTALSTYSSLESLLCPSTYSGHAGEPKCRENSACFTSSPLLTVSDIKDPCSIVSDRWETDIINEEVSVAQSTEAKLDCAMKSPQGTNNGEADAQVNLSDHNYSFSVWKECRKQDLHQEERLELLCSEVEVIVSPCKKSPRQADQRPISDCQVDCKLSHSPSRKGDKLGPGPNSVKEPELALAEKGDFKPSFGFAEDCNNNVEPHGPSQMMRPTVYEQTGPGISSSTLELGLPADQPEPDHKSLCDQEGELNKDRGKAQAQSQLQTAPQPNKRWSRTPRKQAHPCRSADPRDPNLQGVIFSMNTKLDDCSNQCRLLITSNYSKQLRKRPCRQRCRALRLSKETNSSEEEEESEPCSLSKLKTCASCCTRKTPLWRDAEDGTPLCNACGIRYKKYRVRCTNCWHIPRKDSKSRSQCFKCGDMLRLTFHQKRCGW